MKTITKRYNETALKPYKLYIVTCGIAHKIGISNDPEGRLCGIQTGCPYKAELVKVYDYGEADALCAERWLHGTFRNFNTYGEWFDAPLEKILFIADRLWDMYNIRYDKKIRETTEAANRAFPIQNIEEVNDPTEEVFDDVERWVNSECIKETGRRISRTYLYREYEMSRHKDGEEAMSRNIFYKKLRELGMKEAQAHGERFFLGLKLKEAKHDSSDDMGAGRT